MIVREMAGGIEALAPAKLNLYLEVLGRRDDGYHELESLMVAIDYYDTLRFADDAEPGSIAMSCDDPTLATDRTNLVVRAAESLRDRAGRPDLGARIDLAKAIPARAGLGGGSSDAAATLVALDQLWSLKTPRDGLIELAAGLGSDVPFFLNGPAAICRGRGERVESIRLPGPLSFVLICPDEGVSTADVYRDLRPPDRPRSIAAAREALEGGDPERLGRCLFNRLEGVAESIAPGLSRVRRALEDRGPSLDGHLMSGSGSAYFGLARDHRAARTAAEQLGSLGLGRVRVVTCGP